MFYKKAIIFIFLLLLVVSACFAAYRYLDQRLRGNSVGIRKAQDGFFTRRSLAFPEGIQMISPEEYMDAMEEDEELSDEALRESIENFFNPTATTAAFVLNNADEFLYFRGNDDIFEREEISDRIINILFLGDDARIYQERGRSDTIMLISYNRDTHVITLTSFMRDILVPFTGLNSTYWNRINLMYALGGPGRTINVINYLYALDIQRYAAVRFSGVFALVDALEGLELYLRDDEAAMINRIFPDYEAVSGGYNLLDGRQVLAYSRMRVLDGDLVRTQRQRNVIITLLNKILDTRNISDIFSMAAFALDHLETNIQLDEIFTFGIELFSGPRPHVEELRLPIDGSFNHGQFNGAFILTIDFDENVRALHEAVYGSAEGVEIPFYALPEMDQSETAAIAEEFDND